MSCSIYTYLYKFYNLVRVAVMGNSFHNRLSDVLIHSVPTIIVYSNSLIVTTTLYYIFKGCDSLFEVFHLKFKATLNDTTIVS